MRLSSSYPLPGLYQYTYPTFADTPQTVCVHFLTPDQQHAFVSYPHHPNHKAAQLIDVSWFNSVKLVKLNGQPQLMHFLDVILPSLLESCLAKVMPLDPLTTRRLNYGVNELLVAFG
ncbi:hypothetical protein [Spirosoma endophyticum]|uniref:Uncharacterized protein n=1 Tax=Spirosoma endophyticum TaxID=662367 RepID=A0A1I2E940_9BACT|nr:hypothetical protein [Spirosoma endophyticum]SFE89472.1 hypothetical protein SAMN05216167_12176 [Spirosoma endophyticum]